MPGSLCCLLAQKLQKITFEKFVNGFFERTCLLVAGFHFHQVMERPKIVRIQPGSKFMMVSNDFFKERFL